MVAMFRKVKIILSTEVKEGGDDVFLVFKGGVEE